MGGLWEAGIKSVKYHLKRTLGRSRLTYEEFETVIIPERKVDDREGQCNVWYNGNCKGGFYTSLQLAFRRVVEVYHGSDGKWLATLTAVLLGLGSNPGEDTDVYKCIVPSRYRSTLNSRRVASPLVMLVEGEERWEASDHSQGVLAQNCGEIVLSSVWCSKLRLTTDVT
ncbi:uncharacterized protein TNCV_500831 [Trichonephila clavipes]|nr:uncharacterized protein TNCV_500831 [Trichonephila clavipes]